MDTRHPIQTSSEPAVLSVSFNSTGSRFICGLTNGLRVFRSQDCVRTIKECKSISVRHDWTGGLMVWKAPDPGKGIGIAALVDDRYVAVVGGGKVPNSSRNVLKYWDNVAGILRESLDFAEPILGIRMTVRNTAVILKERVVFFYYTYDETNDCIVPQSPAVIHDTMDNIYAICSLRTEKAAFPGQSIGQVQILSLTDKTKKVLRCHTSELRQLDLSNDGEVLVTASKQGTLIRVFSTSTLIQTHEFRRGVDSANIYSLRISPKAELIACTSDKGTIHIFDLRGSPSDASRSPIQAGQTSARRNTDRSHRPGSIDFETASAPSQLASVRPSSRTGGFHGVRTDTAQSPPSAAPTALSALSKLPGMPKAFADVRSSTSIPYYLGSESSNWQGQVDVIIDNDSENANSSTVSGLISTKPPKGVLCWDPEGGDRRFWCVGGGSDARWEMFEVLEGSEGRLKVVNRGFRKYLSRQFPSDGS